MEGIPKFRPVKETPYGSHLERVRTGEDDTERVPGELSDKQQEDLRAALSQVGVPLKKKPNLTRRGFLGGSLAAVGVGVGASLLKEREVDAVPEVAPEAVQPEEVVAVEPNVESIPLQNQRFESEVIGYKVFTQLRKNEVLYVNERNEPVGPPRQFENFVDEKRNATGELVMEEYLFSPGTENEAGFVEEGIAGEWLDYVQAIVQAEFPGETIANRMNVIADFRAAYNEADEPELVAAILSGEISHYDEIVSYFAEKPVLGAEEYSRREYAQQMMQFRSKEEQGRPAVPETVQAELRSIIPGLFAQESKFNAGLVSSTGAKGLAQIMPDTWEEYRGTTEVSLSMVEQVAVAGELISDNYHYLVHYAGTEALNTLRELFASDEDFETSLIVPLLVNAYNAGGPLIGMLLKEFVENTPPEALVVGKDIFLQFADYAEQNNEGVFGNYKTHAREYVSRVYGNVEMLKEKYTV